MPDHFVADIQTGQDEHQGEDRPSPVGTLLGQSEPVSQLFFLRNKPKLVYRMIRTRSTGFVTLATASVDSDEDMSILGQLPEENFGLTMKLLG